MLLSLTESHCADTRLY